MSCRDRAGRISFLVLAASILAGVVPAQAQMSGRTPGDILPNPNRRPIPYPVLPSAEFVRAMENGTRTETGRPGPGYWQQDARYEIEARIDTERKWIEGSARIVYHNRSPDALSRLVLKIYQNLHAAEAARHYEQEVTGGMTLRRVAINGMDLSEDRSDGPRYEVEGTVMSVWPAEDVEAGDIVTLDLDWEFVIPEDGAVGRMGWYADDFFYLAYWYPQIAVYDDVVGWHDDRFTGRGELYYGFSDYDLRIDVPAGWVVLGTGDLVNGGQVLRDPILQRLESAESGDAVIRVVTPEDLAAARVTRPSPTGRLTWHLRAERVRDVAFSVTRGSVWDAVRAPVGDRDGDGATDFTRVDALYHPSASAWKEVADYGRHAISYLSALYDFPYPWSHVTAVEGGDWAGGMEYPMMTLMGSYEGLAATSLYGTVAHELAHMWLPMIVGSDEVRWAWMDEGPANYSDTQAGNDFFPDSDANDARSFADIQRGGADAEIMRWTDWAYPGTWSLAAYSKPAAALTALRAILGREAFDQALRSYIRTWSWKHPKPWDFFHTFEHVSGRNLDWFWRGWFYETWTMDHAVVSVEPGGGGTRITIEDRGLLPMPARLSVTRENGETALYTVGVDAWLAGARTAALVVPSGSPVVKVELDAAGSFPDIDRDNDVWNAVP